MYQVFHVFKYFFYKYSLYIFFQKNNGSSKMVYNDTYDINRKICGMPLLSILKEERLQESHCGVVIAKWAP